MAKKELDIEVIWTPEKILEMWSKCVYEPFPPIKTEHLTDEQVEFILSELIKMNKEMSNNEMS